MPLETLIARWVAVMWIVFGLSHALQPGRWAAMFLPLREKEYGGLFIASFTLPIGLIIVLGHDVWVAGIPVIITAAGWLSVLKCLIYLCVPRAHTRVMSAPFQPEKGFRIVGVVMVVLGIITGYDAFFVR